MLPADTHVLYVELAPDEFPDELQIRKKMKWVNDLILVRHAR